MPQHARRGEPRQVTQICARPLKLGWVRSEAGVGTAAQPCRGAKSPTPRPWRPQDGLEDEFQKGPVVRRLKTHDAVALRTVDGNRRRLCRWPGGSTACASNRGRASGLRAFRLPTSVSQTLWLAFRRSLVVSEWELSSVL